ncbi:MAG: hypothetical protein WDZ79_00375 [Candidatus Paceibacterota bacterium]
MFLLLAEAFLFSLIIVVLPNHIKSPGFVALSTPLIISCTTALAFVTN